MTFLKYVFYRSYRLWLLAALTLLGLASQCNSPTPPLPATPAGPALRVALLAPTGGELDTFGRMMRNGILIASDEWNEQGGVLNHRLEWVVYNTGCTFETAQQATQQAIDDGHKFIIGPICSEAAIAAAALAEPAGVLMISPVATHPLVTVNHQGQTRSTIFRVSYTYAQQSQAAARFARDTLKVNKVALLSHPGDTYTTSLTDAFAQEFSTGGGEIVYQATYTPGNTDFTEILTAIDQAGAELIYLPAAPSVANQIGNRLNELGSSGHLSKTGLILLGSDAWASAELDLSATAGSYFATHFSVEADRPFLQSWAESYKSTYATEPNPLAALGYDAVNMLANAIEQAGTFEPAVVARALEQGTFQGVTGPITFDSSHNPIKPVIFVYVEAGGVTYLTSVFDD